MRTTKKIMSDGNKVVFPQGTLRRAISQSAPRKTILTKQEKHNLSEAKKVLEENLSQFISAKASYKHQLITQASQNLLDNSQRLCADIKKILRPSFLVLYRCAVKLLENRQFEAAESEFEIALNYAIQINGELDFETLKTRLHYEYARLHLAKYGMEPAHSIKEIIEKLELQLKYDRSNNQIKQLIANAAFILAQYYVNGDDLNTAAIYSERSKSLRIEYGATEVEMDRIDFLQGKIAYRKEDNETALVILTKCYEFRKSKNKLNPSLVPVIEIIVDILDRHTDAAEKLTYLQHLIAIKRHLNADNREIVSIQLKMLQTMQYNTSDKEYLDTLNSIKHDLNREPVTEESVKVGISLYELADTMLKNLPPHELSNVKKREYYADILKIIAKAEAHLNAANHRSDVNHYGQRLLVLKEDCLKRMNFFSNPTCTQLIGKPLHPDDETELAITSYAVVNESSTMKELNAISEFSSEVRYSQTDPLESKIIEVEDFHALTDSGTIDPYRLRKAQAGINPTFRRDRPLEDMIQALVNNPEYTEKIPPIEIGIHNGKVYSFDTRRLTCHQKAKEQNPEVYIRYRKISGEYLANRVKAIHSDVPWNGLVTAERHGGKGSPSEPYINPAVRAQLEDNVNKNFKPYPSDREGADPNGFPILKKQAENIFNFWKKRAKYYDCVFILTPPVDKLNIRPNRLYISIETDYLIYSVINPEGQGIYNEKIHSSELGEYFSHFNQAMVNSSKVSLAAKKKLLEITSGKGHTQKGEGSARAMNVLKELDIVLKEQGENAGYQFLINTKEHPEIVEMLASSHASREPDDGYTCTSSRDSQLVPAGANHFSHVTPSIISLDNAWRVSWKDSSCILTLDSGEINLSKIRASVTLPLHKNLSRQFPILNISILSERQLQITGLTDASREELQQYLIELGIIMLDSSSISSHLAKNS